MSGHEWSWAVAIKRILNATTVSADHGELLEYTNAYNRKKMKVITIPESKPFPAGPN